MQCKRMITRMFNSKDCYKRSHLEFSFFSPCGYLNIIKVFAQHTTRTRLLSFYSIFFNSCTHGEGLSSAIQVTGCSHNWANAGPWVGGGDEEEGSVYQVPVCFHNTDYSFHHRLKSRTQEKLVPVQMYMDEVREQRSPLPWRRSLGSALTDAEFFLAEALL